MNRSAVAWSFVSILGLGLGSSVRAQGQASSTPRVENAEAALPAGADRRPEIPKGVYDKPFLKRFGHGAGIGGYIDLEFRADENGSTFDQHRFVPFIYAQVSDHVSMASEIEFEHGGFVTGEPEETDGEIKVEFAHIDLSAAEWLVFRAGVPVNVDALFHLVAGVRDRQGG